MEFPQCFLSRGGFGSLPGATYPSRATVAVLCAHFAAAEIADGFLGGLLGLTLGAMDAAGTLCAGLSHGPVVAVPDDETIVVRQCCLHGSANFVLL
jgi:hypothetical protein